MNLHFHFWHYVRTRGAYLYFECRCGARKAELRSRRVVGVKDRSWLDGGPWTRERD